MTIILTGGGEFYDAAKDVAGEHAGLVCRNSFVNSRFVEVLGQGEHFRSERTFRPKFSLLPAGTDQFGLSADGIGTKVIIADALEIYRTMARDLIAMGVDDVARFGGLPLVFANVLDVRSMDADEQKTAFMDLMTGLAEVAKEQDLVVLQGETASLGPTVSSPNPNSTLAFNWSGTVFSVANDTLRISQDIQAGDYIVALKQDGFRSNGISKVRKAFEQKYGQNWYKDAPKEEIEAALTPSVPYARAISEANGWYSQGERLVEITGIAHLSGGSFVSKFLEPMLQSKGLSARLNNLFDIPEIVLKTREWLGNMSDEEMFKTWCCGQGMLVMFRTQEDADKFIDICAKFGVEGKIAGNIISSIRSQSKIEI